MYRMKLKGMYVTKVDYTLKEHVVKTLDETEVIRYSVRIRAIEAESGKNGAIILEDFEESGSVIEGLESLGYKKEEVDHPNPMRHFGVDYRGGFEA